MSKVSVLRDYQSLCDILMAEIVYEEDDETRGELLRDMVRVLRIINKIQREI